MKIIIVILSFVATLTQSYPVDFLYDGTPLVAPLYKRLAQGAPIGFDGRVVDTPEVSLAKVQHATAHANERINLAHEAAKSSDSVYGISPAIVNAPAIQRVPAAVSGIRTVGGAPIGPDGKVVDTPEVSIAKAEHATAHINERITHDQEIVKSSYYDSSFVVPAYSIPVFV